MLVEMVSWTPETLIARLNDIAAVYQEVYGAPESAGATFAEMLQEHAQRDGFRLIAALDGDTLIGFGYGFTGQAGQPWRDLLAQTLGSSLEDRWLNGHFEFAEFGVRPGYRRKGIGSMIHDAMLTALPNRHAVLTVREHNRAARHLYEGRGWQTLFENFFTAAGRGPYHVMGYELPLVLRVQVD